MNDQNIQRDEFEMATEKSIETATRSIELISSPGLKDWLSKNCLSLVFNTYNVGKLFMIGVNDMKQIQFTDASFRRSMGMAFHDGTLWMGSENQIWRFENFLHRGQTSNGHDAVFVPVGATTTGMINVHDVCVSDQGVFFVSCNFNCVAKLHKQWSFEPYWIPTFIGELEYGDKCHLNCLALENGRPKYATCFAKTNLRHGWRDTPRDQATGVVIDVETDEVVCEGLDMPHSPRLHQGQLYLTNSGRGELGRVDLASGIYHPICEVPGFTRGLSFWKNYAIVGSSKPRSHGVFEGNDATPLNKRLQESGEDPKCQISIIDLKTGERVHSLTIEGPASEIYEVCVLPGIQRPLVLDIDDPLVNTTFRPSKFGI